jgi:predicted ArsR family transcriptional regulator
LSKFEVVARCGSPATKERVTALRTARVLDAYLMNYEGVLKMAAKGRAARKRKPSGPWREIIDECVGKALGNSFRQQILWMINERPTSASEIAKEMGETLSRVCHHIEVLKDAKCIEVAFTRRAGNRVQSFYKATARAFLDDMEWPKVPESLKEGLRATLLRNVLDDAIEAVVEGTFDSFEADAEAHLSWTPMILDGQGWEELAEILERALKEAIETQESASERLLASGEKGTSCTVSILGYASVGGQKAVRPPSDAKELVGAANRKMKGMKKAGRTRAKTKSRAKRTGE